MTIEWRSIYKTLDAMRFRVRERLRDIRPVYGIADDEAELVNALCRRIWDAALRYAAQYAVIVKGEDADAPLALQSGTSPVPRHPPDEESKLARLRQLDQRLKDALGDLVEEPEETEAEDAEDEDEDPWDRPDAYDQWIMVEFAEIIRDVSPLEDRLSEDDHATLGTGRRQHHCWEILQRRGFDGLMHAIWKQIGREGR